MAANKDPRNHSAPLCPLLSLFIIKFVTMSFECNARKNSEMSTKLSTLSIYHN